MTQDRLVEVSPLFKDDPTRGECEGDRDRCSSDSCPIIGRYQTRSYRDLRRRVFGCDDFQARGRRNKRKGADKGRVARKGLRLGGPATAHEELWQGAVRTEAKAGRTAKPVETAYKLVRAQSDAARPVGKTEPFVGSFAPDESSHVYYVIRDDDLEAVVFACAEAWA